MSNSASAGVPPPSELVFQNGISHPDLWLWDSWVVTDGDELHLYCLALARQADDGSAIRPEDRNNHAFHVRHFTSGNLGQTWRDKGQFAGSGRLSDGSDAHNVWSGSACQLDRSMYLFAHTGIRQPDSERPFVQSINASLAKNPESSPPKPMVALSCPIRDYDEIIGAGYYLGTREMIGHADGEDGGPILAWRDPFTFIDPEGGINLFFSAKTGPKTPAVAHATLALNDGKITINALHPPLALPDADDYTQAEVPKIYHDEKRDLYYLLVSSCDRLYEGQPDSEVHKEHRLYKATALDGPWAPYHAAGSVLPGLDGLFGASLIEANFDTGDFKFIAPYTEMVSEHKQLTFAPVRSVNIYTDPASIENAMSGSLSN